MATPLSETIPHPDKRYQRSDSQHPRTLDAETGGVVMAELNRVRRERDDARAELNRLRLVACAARCAYAAWLHRTDQAAALARLGIVLDACGE